MNQIKKNFIYNVFYQILLLILPIVTVPYVSRILGSEGLGIYSYTYSIVNYFMLFAMLGINNYGSRSIAKVRNDKEKLSKYFFSIYSIQLITTFIMIICYLIFILLFNFDYKYIAIIQIINIISVLFDINWFFFGLEKFKITVTRSTILKLLSVILIFMFVKSSNDLWIYTIIIATSTLLSQLILLPFLKKEISFFKIKRKDITKHIKPIIILFIPVVAISLYQVMDKIMLGNMSVINEVGYYEQAGKIVSIPLSLITALGTIMLPRISNLVAIKDLNAIKKYIYKSVKFMMFLAFPICLGLIAVSSDFIPVFLGYEFTKSSVLIYYLSITIIFISFANIVRTQYLIPNEKDKIYVISVIGGAFVNLIANLLLIPHFHSIGACIGTIFAEFFVMIYQTIAVRKELPLVSYFKSILPFIIKALIMFSTVMIIKFINIIPVFRFILQVIIGIIIYGLLNIKYVLELLNISGGKYDKKKKKIYN